MIMLISIGIFHSNNSNFKKTKINDIFSTSTNSLIQKSTKIQKSSINNTGNVTALCPISIWGYGYVYPNETLALVTYLSTDYLKNGSIIIVSLADNFTSTYNVREALSLSNSSGIAGYVPISLYLKFRTLGKQVGVVGSALSLQIWNQSKILRSTRANVWLHFEVSKVLPTEVRLKFKRYSFLYVSFKQGVDIFNYTVQFENLYNTPIVLQNVSFPLSTLQKYPKPPSIQINRFNVVDTTTKKMLKEIPPNSAVLLNVVIEVPSNVYGLYFKPKLVFKVDNTTIEVPAPPMEYIRAIECGK
ncbi:hypothetical protein VFC49_02725 [Thermococcus sp. SY098]|uniref:hypothetical protein n=1 Tax=Thermococcus sp. SY098 TaxID=3111325 RepID=UPI002D7707E7|nr:hypothetical protein [Thermococcus sp. SY098]WRS53075.1 hypothetical protein VFC49_02725 [Thermococcus sp. SY098]